MSYTSIHKALAESVCTTIQGMLGTSIVGPASDSVRVRKTAYYGDFSGQNPLPASYQYSLPGIIVCYFDAEEIDPLAGTNARDEIGYPITIVFAQENQSASTPSEAGDDAFLTWRQAVRKKFQHLRGLSPSGFLTVTAGGTDYTFHNCVYRGGLIFDVDRETKKNIDLGYMKFSFILWDGV